MNECTLHEGSFRPAFALAALGIVFGDIGTSPLYAFRECLAESGDPAVGMPAVIGLLSLIVWALILIVTLKYAWLMLRADNDGEGGILALTALVRKSVSSIDPASRRRGVPVVILLGIVGTTLFLADGMITPAISVLSAVEGIEVVSPGHSRLAVPLTVGILAALFFLQSIGTARIGALFGPIVLCWFLVLGGLGLREVWGEWGMLAAFNPVHGLRFLWEHGLGSLGVLGAVFLVATGAEALYADLGHFGPRAIRIGWFGVALPGLLLNYFGQGALVLRDSAAIDSPFYRLAPAPLLVPLVVLATAATIIASQAVITGAFSLARQAVTLGLVPRLDIRHTSESLIGQVYVPVINTALMVGAIALVLMLESSDRIASAYGLAVSLTMLVTVVLVYLLFRHGYRWPTWRCLFLVGPFAVVDAAFVAANFTKVLSGGWIPLAAGAAGAFVLVTWFRGQSLLRSRVDEVGLSEEEFLDQIGRHPPARVRGTAVMITRLRSGVPLTLLHLLKHTKAMHETVVLLTIEVSQRPRVGDADRIRVCDFGGRILRMNASFGFMESPDIPALLRDAQQAGRLPPLKDITYIVGRVTLVPARKPRLRWFPRGLFAFLFHNAYEVTRYFGIPPSRTIEIGAPVEV